MSNSTHDNPTTSQESLTGKVPASTAQEFKRKFSGAEMALLLCLYVVYNIVKPFL